MGGRFYAICLFLACLAAAMLGYALGGQVVDNGGLNRLKTASLPPEVDYYGTVEAQGVDLPEPHFDSYEEYEQHVMEYVNDRSNYE